MGSSTKTHREESHEVSDALKVLGKRVEYRTILPKSGGVEHHYPAPVHDDLPKEDWHDNVLEII